MTRTYPGWLYSLLSWNWFSICAPKKTKTKKTSKKTKTWQRPHVQVRSSGGITSHKHYLFFYDICTNINCWLNIAWHFQVGSFKVNQRRKEGTPMLLPAWIVVLLHLWIGCMEIQNYADSQESGMTSNYYAANITLFISHVSWLHDLEICHLYFVGSLEESRNILFIFIH